VCEEVRAELSFYVGVTLCLCLVVFWHKKLDSMVFWQAGFFEWCFGTFGFH
jgi:uncharacterized membrane protein YdcZ (DUF606 family)